MSLVAWPCILPPFPLLSSIFFLFPVLFLYRTYQLSLLVHLLWLCCMCHPFLPFPQQILLIFVLPFSTLITLNLYYSYSFYCSLLLSTLHYSTLQHFKLILGYCYSFLHLLLLSAISGQVPETFAIKTQLFFSSFQFCP